MKDVDKFYKALDYAVMKFHSAKMGNLITVLSIVVGNAKYYARLFLDVCRGNQQNFEGSMAKYLSGQRY